MVVDYFKMVVFYFLEVIGSLVNLVCALFSYYPRFEFGVSFMLWAEGRRINKDTKEQAFRRQHDEIKADAAKHEAFKAERAAQEEAQREKEDNAGVTTSTMLSPEEDVNYPSISAKIHDPNR